MALHVDEHRVTARHEHHQQRKLQGGIFQRRRVQMRLHVVDADEGHVPRHRQRLGRRHADEQCADQTRPDRAGHRIDAFVVDSCLDDGAGDHGIEDVEVCSRGNLGNHATEVAVQIDLRRHHVRHHVVATEHERRSRLVTARLDAENQRRLVDDRRLHAHVATRSRIESRSRA